MSSSVRYSVAIDKNDEEKGKGFDVEQLDSSRRKMFDDPDNFFVKKSAEKDLFEEILSNSKIEPVPDNERKYYENIPFWIQSRIRKSSLFREAKCILMSNFNSGDSDLDEIEIELLSIGFFKLNKESTELIRYYCVTTEINYGLTSEQEIKDLQENEIDDFLKDRLIIQTMITKEGNLSFSLFLDRPKLEEEGVELEIEEELK